MAIGNQLTSLPFKGLTKMCFSFATVTLTLTYDLATRPRLRRW